MADLLDVFSLDVGTIVEPAKLEAVLAYGPAGSGKTHFALSVSEVEKYSPVLVIDTENSVSGVIDNFRQRDPNDPTNVAFDHDSGKGIVDVVRPLETWGDTAYENTMRLLERVAAGETIYKTVVIDVADVLQQWGLQHHIDPKDQYKHWTEVDRDLTGAPMTAKNQRNRGMFYRLKMSGVLLILVVHEKEDPQEDGPDLSKYAWQGQGRGKLGGIPDAVFYFKRRASLGGAKTTMYTEGRATFQAKNRFNLPTEYTNPTFKQIVEDAQKKKENN